jgi:hypothetical protein
MSQNKISRRDAIKILGAAIGGAALSTIPPKWSQPVLAASQLPEHARQSVVAVCTTNALVLEILSSSTGDFNGPSMNILPDNSIPGNTSRQIVWNCTHSGCFLGTFPLRNPPAGTTVTANVSTFSQGPVSVVWNDANPSHTISVNFATGALAIDGIAAGCPIT